jgi:hypothetical protein
MSWFIVALIAFFLLAVATVTDKFMLTKTAVVPASFSFYIALMGTVMCVVLYLPILLVEKKFFFPTGWPLAFAFINGASQYFGLLFLFESVNRGEVSKANPVIISLQPVFTIPLTMILPIVLLSLSMNLDTGLQMISILKIVGVILIVLGGYLLSQVGLEKARFNGITWVFVILAGFLLALSSVSAKVSYSLFDTVYAPAGIGHSVKYTFFNAINVNWDMKAVAFWKAFIWGRWMTLVAGLIFMIVTWNFKTLLVKGKEEKQEGAPKGGWVAVIFLFGQICGAVAVVLQQYALKLGNAILITALNGIQFFFVIAIMFILTKFFPKILKEDMSRKVLSMKVIWSIVLCMGVALIIAPDNAFMRLFVRH